MELVVTAPRLLSLPPAMLQSSQALTRLASWATRESLGQASEVAALDALGMRGASIGALIARGAGIDPGADHWLVADPVSLVAGIDDVVVAARVEDADAAFVARAVGLLNAHFADDGAALVAPRPERWLLRMHDAPHSTFTATDLAIGGSAYAHRPQGGDARRFERYANEVQMLLHDAPENDERARNGLPPLNGLWWWDGPPSAQPSSPMVRIDVYAATGADGDLARGAALASGGAAHPLGARLEFAGRRAALVLVALPAMTPADFAQYEAGWLAPAVDALAGHRLTRLTLIAGGAATHRWTAAPPTLVRRLRARFTKSRFGVPP
jgi:hypothetical protein